MNLIIKGKHKKTLIFPVFSGDSVFNRIHFNSLILPYFMGEGNVNRKTDALFHVGAHKLKWVYSP